MYTRAWYVEAARLVLSEIDVDPTSCQQTQGAVRSRQFCTTETNGLHQEWRGTVFLNPPFCHELLSAFTNKLIEELKEQMVLGGNFAHQ